MRSRIVLSTLALLGAFALSATRAEAGAGGRPVPLQGFYVCQGISGGAAVNQAFDLEVLPGVVIKNIKIGNSNLACIFARLLRPNPDPQQPPVPVEPLESEDQIRRSLKCYAIVSGQAGNPPQGTNLRFKNEDAFGAESNLQLSNNKYLCAPTEFDADSP